MWPALVTTGLLAFIAAWNEFLFALTFTLVRTRRAPCRWRSRSISGAQPARTALGQHHGRLGHRDPAAVIVLVLIFQRKIVAGLTAGAVKG